MSRIIFVTTKRINAPKVDKSIGSLSQAIGA